MRTIIFSVQYLTLVFVTLLTACNSGTRGIKENPGEKWIQLFNGKDLNDWQVKFKGYELGFNLNNTFRVEDGLLRVCYNDWDKWGDEYGHIFYKDEFSHYILRVEYRFVGEQVKGAPAWAFRNNGLMIHGQNAESMEIDQDFPVSIEVQLMGGSGIGERPTMNVCTPGTNIVMGGKLVEQHCTLSQSKTFNGDKWVTVEVEVHGGEVIRHFVNGKEVLQYEKPQLDPKDRNYEKLMAENGSVILTKGTISLQAESSPTDFRRIEILVLDE